MTRAPRKNARIDAFVLEALGFEGARENPFAADADFPAFARHRGKIAEHRSLAAAARQRARYDADEDDLEVAAYHEAEAKRLEAELDAVGRGMRRRRRRNPSEGDAFHKAFRQGVKAVASDPLVAEWLEENGWGETPADSLVQGGCLVFAFGLVKADDRFSPYGLGYKNLLASQTDVSDLEDEASYEHVVALDRETGLYWDATGARTKKDLLKDYSLNASFKKAYGRTVIEPFNVEQPISIATDEKIEDRIAEILRPFLTNRRNPITPPSTLAFRRWFAGSWVVDDRGQPLLVYRGEHGEDTSELVRSRMGSSVLSFTDSADLASHFAMERYREGETPTPRLVPVYLRIKNPVITPDDVDQTGEEFTVSTQTMIDRVGRAAVKKVFDELRPGLMDDPEYALPPFGYLNNLAFVKAAKKKGYDGALFLGDYLLFEKGRYINFGKCMEYRPFSLEQVWPALGAAPLA